MKNYLNTDTPGGCLAEDMHEDKEKFPRNNGVKYAGWHRYIRSYLTENEACDNCLEVFEKCWEEYEIEERKKRGMPTRIRS
ncbi:MAG: sterile alpha motif-like domain-containing protein [Clostridiales bacterium]|nr:sterile alpha motif-like domain-containing protein [Clostridiales bacterium]